MKTGQQKVFSDNAGGGRGIQESLKRKFKAILQEEGEVCKKVQEKKREEKMHREDQGCERLGGEFISSSQSRSIKTRSTNNMLFMSLVHHNLI